MSSLDSPPTSQQHDCAFHAPTVFTEVRLRASDHTCSVVLPFRILVSCTPQPVRTKGPAKTCVSAAGSAPGALCSDPSYVEHYIQTFGLKTVQANPARTIRVGQCLGCPIVFKEWPEWRATEHIQQIVNEIAITRHPLGSYGDVSAPAFIRRLPTGGGGGCLHTPTLGWTMASCLRPHTRPRTWRW